MMESVTEIKEKQVPSTKILQKEFSKLVDIKKLLSFFLYLHILILFFFRIEAILNFFLDSFIMPYLLNIDVEAKNIGASSLNLAEQLQNSITKISGKQFTAAVVEGIFVIITFFLLAVFLFRIVKCLKLAKGQEMGLSPFRTLILSLIPVVNIVYIARIMPFIFKESIYKNENSYLKVNYLVVLFWPYMVLAYLTIYIVQFIFLDSALIISLAAYVDILNLHISADYFSAFVTIMTIYIISNMFGRLQSYYKKLSAENTEN